MNLLRSDQSTLSVDQWNLLSNLIHCYDEHSGFSIAKRYVHEHNVLPLKIRYKIASINELCTSLISGAQLLFEKNLDFLSLSSQDRSLLLHGKLKYLGGLGTCFILRHVGLFDTAAFYQNAELIYGSTTLSAGKLASNQLDSDIVFIKMVLSILAVSTFDYTFYTNTAPINLFSLQIQSFSRVLFVFRTLYGAFF